MKTLLSTALALIMALCAFGQSRVDSAPESLTYKSQEVKKALYWQQKDGKWKSRKNDKLEYLGEGVHVPNFMTMFIGEYKAHRYLFVEERIYQWRYPNLQTEWVFRQTLLAFELSETTEDEMRNIEVGQTLKVTTRYMNDLFRGHPDFSWAFFLRLTDTMREEGSLKTAMVIKRVMDNSKDVVRFTLYPQALEELIDFSYFEIPYSDYERLFTPAPTTAYK